MSCSACKCYRPYYDIGYGSVATDYFYPFRYTSQYGRGTVLHTVIKSPVYESKTYGTAPYLDGVLVWNEAEEELVLFAVNKCLDEDMEITCDLRQFEKFQIEEHVVLSHQDMKAVNTEENPQTVSPTAGNTVKLEAGKLSGILGKHSWNMIRMKRK